MMQNFYQMILKLLYKQNISVKYIPMILVKMRMGGASNSSLINRMKANKEDWLAWTKNQLNKPMFIRIKKPLQKIKQFFLKPKVQLKVLIVDNNDSFSYNLKHYIEQFSKEVKVIRGNKLNLNCTDEFTKIIFKCK